MADVVELAEDLVDAFNRRDIDRVMALVTDDVELDLGHRTLKGRHELREFVERQLFGIGYRATHGRRFRRGDELVAESRQEMSYAESGEAAGVEEVAVRYVARGGLVARYAEFPDLAAAFEAGQVEESDELAV